MLLVQCFYAASTRTYVPVHCEIPYSNTIMVLFTVPEY